jgi:hypothetical protein
VWEWAFYLASLLPMALVALPFIGYARTQRLQGFARDPRLAALGLFFLLYGLASVVQTGGLVAVYIGDGPPPFSGHEGDGGAIHCITDDANGTVHCTRSSPGSSGDLNTSKPAPPGRNGTGEFRYRIEDRLTVPVQRLWTFWLHHGLVLASLAVASYAYIRPSREDRHGDGGNGGTGGSGGASNGKMLVALPFLVLANAVLQSLEAILALMPAVLAFINWRSRRTPGSLQVALGFALLALAHIAVLGVFIVRPLVFVPVFDLLALAGIATLVFAVPRGP